MNVVSGAISASSSSAVAVGSPFCRVCFSSSKTLISSFWRTGNTMPQFSSSASPTTPTASPPAVEVEPLQPKPKPWLVVGLGNPGKMYRGTRHNVGFEMVDAIAEAEGISMSSVSFKALFGKGFIGNVPVMLAKPQTFMNASGESVGAIVKYYKIPLKQVLVIFDDLDLPFAKLRLLPKGGHGGHNGMRSVIDHFKGSRDFPRLRIGIGRPPGKMDPINYVLRSFNRQERQELDFTIQNGVEAVRILLQEGLNKSATFVNSAKSLEQLH
ncbi:peptidyl-tRNA hydrolase, mitochondrial [Cornus florida]|uniref:peptidyl-tRNA hydrolase, mitochondrial n=1 Tax=Cornus florida TaxID=4283 RepID=UPI00289CF240|nr:peptidyl-tRNA hydrolase, mitochondrial [Cornus florida]